MDQENGRTKKMVRNFTSLLLYIYRYAGGERDSCFFLQNTTPKLIKAPASLLASLRLRLRDGERGVDEVSKHGSSSGRLRRSALAMRAREGYRRASWDGARASRAWRRRSPPCRTCPRHATEVRDKLEHGDWVVCPRNGDELAHALR
jgi:hypothetical protein